jgi:hypothetical protein
MIPCEPTVVPNMKTHASSSVFCSEHQSDDSPSSNAAFPAGFLTFLIGQVARVQTAVLCFSQEFYFVCVAHLPGDK